jgi:protease-4
MSPESKEANQRWLDQLWQSYVADVAEQREIEPDAVAPNKDHFLELLRKAGGNAASYALDNGLVDQLATRDE